MDGQVDRQRYREMDRDRQVDAKRQIGDRQMGRQIYSQVHNAHKQALRCAHTDTWVLTDTHTHTHTCRYTHACIHACGIFV